MAIRRFPPIIALVLVLAVLAVVMRWSQRPRQAAGPDPPRLAVRSPSPAGSGEVYGALVVTTDTSAIHHEAAYTDDCQIYKDPMGDGATPLKVVQPNHRGHYQATLPCGKYYVTIDRYSDMGGNYTVRPVPFEITPGGAVRVDVVVDSHFGG